MPDMLVKLYDRPDSAVASARAAAADVTIRRAAAYEKHVVVDWVAAHFSGGWAAEADVAFAHVPPTCFIATRDGVILGFACFESTCRNFFGPMGVVESQQGNGIGAALLVASLDAMHAMGYAYAVIGGAGPTGFYEKHAGATVIDGSEPGIYRDFLKLEAEQR
jgi:GNAT superfamily N-acetyltransferase